jgi:hypothetical protein
MGGLHIESSLKLLGNVVEGVFSVNGLEAEAGASQLTSSCVPINLLSFASAASTQALNVDNIQGDIMFVVSDFDLLGSYLIYFSIGLPKRVQRFMFYDITDVGRFRRNLGELATTITTMKDVMNDMDAIQDVKRSGQNRLIPISGTNIAFSHTGLQKVRFGCSLQRFDIPTYLCT